MWIADDGRILTVAVPIERSDAMSAMLAVLSAMPPNERDALSDALDELQFVVCDAVDAMPVDRKVEVDFVGQRVPEEWLVGLAGADVWDGRYGQIVAEVPLRWRLDVVLAVLGVLAIVPD